MKRNEHTIQREFASVPAIYRERGLAAVILYLVCSRYEHGMNIRSMDTDAEMRRTLRELEADRSIVIYKVKMAKSAHNRRQVTVLQVIPTPDGRGRFDRIAGTEKISARA